MKVRELLALLMESDPEAQVMVYSEVDEGASWASGVIRCTTSMVLEDHRPYVKGDWPDRGMKSKLPLVIIR